MNAPPGWFERLAGSLHQVRFPAPGDSRLVPAPVRFESPPQRSAVLVLFGPGDDEARRGPDLLLTRRSAQLRAHAGQVAFPGGRIDAVDDGPAAAALREAAEETGLDPAGVDVRAVGPPLPVSVTNFVVEPVLAWWRCPATVEVVDPAEVDAVARVPVADLVDPANRFTVTHPSGFSGPGFEVGGLFVWGFTAGVLSGLLALAGLERPWDAGRRVALAPSRTGAAVDPVRAQAAQVPE